MLILLLSIVGSLPFESVVKSQVDLVEVNHMYDDQGRLVFDQIIYYDWYRLDNRYHVRDWRLIKSPSQIPSKVHGAGYYQSVWRDGDTIRQIRTKIVRETWTTFDPEIEERSLCPKEHRKLLMKSTRLPHANPR